jgi:hypothetical protein
MKFQILAGLLSPESNLDAAAILNAGAGIGPHANRGRLEKPVSREALHPSASPLEPGPAAMPCLSQAWE